MDQKKNNPFSKINPKDPNQNPKGTPPKKGGKMNFYWIYALIAVVLIALNLFTWNMGMEHITFGDFKKMVEAGDVEKVIIYNNETAQVFIKTDSLDKYKDKLGEAIETRPAGPQFVFNVPQGDFFAESLNRWQEEKGLEYDYVKQENWMTDFLAYLLPFALLIGFWFFIMRRMGGGGGPGGQIFNIGKSKATLFDKNLHSKVTFDDVAGLEEAKEEIKEIVDFLMNPAKYTSLGAKIPKGALLVGPPGTGKTLLAKAVAGEAQVPFFSLSGSDFVEMFVGVGASRVRDLFKQAKEKAPSIIFIDEIDAIGRARGKSPIQGANDERENTLNQLLTEMDGFGSNSGVIILAATNRADILDRALLRPGRFDRQIHVDLPELEERKAIFKVHLKPIKLAGDIDINFLASQTPGFSGADIANLCNEAALIAARRKKKQVDIDDFMSAVDRIIAGLEKKSKIISPQEKKVIAFHEAGHATVSWLLEHAPPLVKVTIVPRGRSLGAAWYLPEERQITTKSQMYDEICATLGGRAAEQVIFGEVSTGALNDLEKVTKQTYAMVTYYGLDDELGNLSFYDSTGQSEYSFQKPYSDKTAEKIDDVVKRIVDELYEKTVKLLEENKDKLTELANLLLSKEVIFREDLVRIFGERQFDKDKKLESIREGMEYPHENKKPEANDAGGKDEIKNEQTTLAETPENAEKPSNGAPSVKESTVKDNPTDNEKTAEK